MCIWDLQCFQSYPNCNIFGKFFLLRNFYSGNEPHGNYGKHCLTHHFQHCAQCVYETYSVFKVIQIAIFLHIFPFTKFLLRWCATWLLWQTLFNSSFPTLRKLCISDLQYFQSFRNSCLFCSHFFLDIWTPLILTMLAMVNVVQIIISNIAHSVYMRFSLFLKFAKMQFVLHILAYSKFLLRSWATC